MPLIKTELNKNLENFLIHISMHVFFSPDRPDTTDEFNQPTVLKIVQPSHLAIEFGSLECITKPTTTMKSAISFPKSE